MDMITIRKLRLSDVNAAYGLMQAVLSSELKYYSNNSRKWELWAYNPKRMRFDIKSKYSVMLGASIDKKLVGVEMAFVEYGGVINSDWLLIDKKYRDHGIGKKLIHQAEVVSKRMGMHKIYGDTEIKNKKAQAFMRKVGWKKVATLMDWNWHENRYVWEKKL